MYNLYYCQRLIVEIHFRISKTNVVESGVKQELQDVGERVKGEWVGVFERAADINGGYSLNQ